MCRIGSAQPPQVRGLKRLISVVQEPGEDLLNLVRRWFSPLGCANTLPRHPVSGVWCLPPRGLPCHSKAMTLLVTKLGGGSDDWSQEPSKRV